MKKMKKLNFSNRWIVVTGASSGLGREMARRLAAAERAHLIVAARRRDRLQALKEEIEGSTGVTVEVVPVDLAQPAGPEQLFKRAVEIAPVYAVINNAGMTAYGRTGIEHLATYEKIITLDLSAVIRLSLLFLDYFRHKGEGAILNVTSEAAFTPLPYQNVYSAAKHGVQSFTEALRAENRKSSIAICTFVPGGIATEMIDKSGLSKKIERDGFYNMKPDRAARLAIKDFKKGKAVGIPGFLNQLNHCLMALLPRTWNIKMTEAFYRPPEE
jgi:hypothetical protein